MPEPPPDPRKNARRFRRNCRINDRFCGCCRGHRRCDDRCDLAKQKNLREELKKFDKQNRRRCGAMGLQEVTQPGNLCPDARELSIPATSRAGIPYPVSRVGKTNRQVKRLPNIPRPALGRAMATIQTSVTAACWSIACGSTILAAASSTPYYFGVRANCPAILNCLTGLAMDSSKRWTSNTCIGSGSSPHVSAIHASFARGQEHDPQNQLSPHEPFALGGNYPRQLWR